MGRSVPKADGKGVRGTRGGVVVVLLYGTEPLLAVKFPSSKISLYLAKASILGEVREESPSPMNENCTAEVEVAQV